MSKNRLVFIDGYMVPDGWEVHAAGESHEWWEPAECAPSGRLVMTCIDDGRGVRNVQAMRKGEEPWDSADGRRTLWFVGDSHVYYEPTHYRELTREERHSHGGHVASSNRRYRVDELFL